MWHYMTSPRVLILVHSSPTKNRRDMHEICKQQAEIKESKNKELPYLRCWLPDIVMHEKVRLWADVLLLKP